MNQLTEIDWNIKNLIRIFLALSILVGIFIWEPPTNVNLQINNLPLFSENSFFGTDRLGRSNISLFIYGIISTLILVIPARILTIFISLCLAFLVQFLPKKSEILWSGISSVFLSVPSLLVALVCIALFPNFNFVVILAIVISDFALAFETISAKIRELQKSEYLISSKTMGANLYLLIRFHYLDALKDILKFLFISGLPPVVMTIALFSYLGIDVSVLNLGPGLGEQISFSKDYFDKTPAAVIFPIFGILLLIYALGTKQK